MGRTVSRERGAGRAPSLPTAPTGRGARRRCTPRRTGYGTTSRPPPDEAPRRPPPGRRGGSGPRPARPASRERLVHAAGPALDRLHAREDVRGRCPATQQAPQLVVVESETELTEDTEVARDVGADHGKQCVHGLSVQGAEFDRMA